MSHSEVSRTIRIIYRIKRKRERKKTIEDEEEFEEEMERDNFKIDFKCIYWMFSFFVMVLRVS